jgi:crotonobetainyl-CoA:carnitine CoA-transferase CaiB-like acyl-CoA transferase
MRSELLNGLRMLDLSDEKGALCGKMFADMGAEVIKIEPPQGCPSRKIPPFLDDQPDLEHSLHFLAFQAGKRSITLNLENADGRELLKQLVKRSDFVVEAFPLGHLDSLGLGYDTLAELNPRLIHASITAFGDRGPGKDYKAADIVSWASGGAMFMMGEEGKPPIQMSLPQAWLHAGAEAAVTSMIAHYARVADGLGQHIVVNAQACVVWTLMNEKAMPLLHGDYLRRSGVFTGAIGGRRKTVYQCKDGHVSFLIAGGAYFNSTNAVIAWLKEEGAAPTWLAEAGGLKTLTPSGFMKASSADLKELDDAEEAIQRFFLTKTKKELWENILKRRLFGAPVANAADIANDPQLKARDYFVSVDHAGLGRKFTLPGAFAKMSETPVGPQGAAPQLGEHNHEIYGGLLGLSKTEIVELRAAGAI